MRKFAFCIIAFAAFFPSTFAQKEKDSALIFHLNNLDEATQDIGKLLSLLEIPMPPQMISAQLGQMLMAPNFTGIDTSGRFTIFLSMKGQGKAPSTPSMAFLLPVLEGGETYLNHLKKSFIKHSTTDDGVTSFLLTPPGSTLEQKHFIKILKGKYALRGSDLEQMKAMANDLSSEELNTINAMPGRLSISINPHILSTYFADQISSRKDMMEKMQPPVGVNSNQVFQGDFSKMMDSYVQVFQHILGQIDSLILNLDVEEQVSLQTFMKPIAESTLAKIIDQTTPVDNVYKAMAENKHALMSFWGTMAGYDLIIDPLGDWMAEIYSAMGPPYSAMAPMYKEMIEETKDFYSGGYSFILLPPTKEQMLSMLGVYGIKDAVQARKKYDAMMKKSEKIMGEIGQEITFKKGESTEYKDIPIDHYLFSMQFPKGQPGLEALNAMYSNMNFAVAYVDNYMLYSMGSSSLLEKGIDQLKSGVFEASSSAVFSDVKEPVLSVMKIDLIKMMSDFGNLFNPEKSLKMEELKGMSGAIQSIVFKKGAGVSSILRLTREDLLNVKKVSSLFSPQSGPSASLAE